VVKSCLATYSTSRVPFPSTPSRGVDAEMGRESDGLDDTEEERRDATCYHTATLA